MLLMNGVADGFHLEMTDCCALSRHPSIELTESSFAGMISTFTISCCDAMCNLSHKSTDNALISCS